MKPWLKNFMQKDNSKPGRSGNDDEHSQPDTKDMTDEDLSDLFMALDDARLHTSDAGARGIDFAVVVLGGIWTMLHLGRAHDAYQGKAIRSMGAAADFARAYGLQTTARFNVDRYGDAGALAMANAWASKSQHFFDMWCTRPADYVFTPADFATWQAPAEFLALLPTLAGPALVRAQALLDNVPQRR